MNVASLELCKELYELSGWKTGGDKPTWNGRKGVNSAPAYDLGYLLRKLPYHGVISGQGTFRQASCSGYIASSDTPEDALAQLAIELHKQGVLTSERLAPKGESKLGGTEET